MISSSYSIDREKILDLDQRSKLLGTCKDKAKLDLFYGRETWVKRYMLVDLELYTGLRVAEIANLKIGDINLRARDPYLIVRNGRGVKEEMCILTKN